MFKGDDLIGVAKTLTESSFEFTIEATKIRAGASNALWGKYYHDSGLNLTLTDAMFDLNYIAANLGVNVEQGGLSVVEEELTVPVAGGSVTVTETPVAFSGTMIGWYKKSTDSDWSIGTIAGKIMTIPGATANDHYCVKYFYQNENAKSVTIKTQYVPSELHVVVINDLFAGDISKQSTTVKYGRLITDVPRLQLDGSQSLELDASSAATVSLTGSALAVSSGDSCEEDPYYATMTQEIFGANWEDEVIALATENSEIELSANETEDIIIRAVFGGLTASQRKDNSNFTFTVLDGDSATVSADGKVTADTAKTGTTNIEVSLTGYPNVPSAFVRVTVA